VIIGHGDIASVLPSRDDLMFIASGVSNSQETRTSEYHREATLILSLPQYKHIVYFSSLSVFYSDTPYTRHKIYMESLIRGACFPHTIIRLGNITWGTNPHTLINSIRNKMLNYEPFEIQDVYRYIVTKEEFLHWINLIPAFSCEMNIPGRMMKVRDIVREYCYPWGKYNGETEYAHSESQLSVCLTDGG
jgi:hypothetical protein